MIFSQLITATDLIERNYHLQERGIFPDLIRRLILHSDPSVKWIHFRAHEGTAIGGWDGIIEEAEGASPYVPSGRSRWELGTNQNAPNKIKGDFEKRDKAPNPEIDISQTALIFVVARRWSGKEDWAKEQTDQQDSWREIHVIDADDLEAWMQLHPAVHIWFSAQLGKYVPGLSDIESWWKDWAHQTDPIMHPSLLLAGRSTTVEHIGKWLRSSEIVLNVFASTAEESLAVVAATILTLPEDQQEYYLSKIIVVRDIEAWNHLVLSHTKLILIPEIETAQLTKLISAATRQGHRVILPRSATEAKPEDFIVTPLQKTAVQKELEQIGIAELEASEKAQLARRSFTAFQRSLLTDKSLQKLWWSEPSIAKKLLPLALLGYWQDEQEGDQRIVEKITGEPYSTTKSLLIEWAKQPNSPVRILAGEWFIIDPADVWEQTVYYFSAEPKQKFEEIILEVLGTSHPRFTLPPNERHTASIRGIKSDYSKRLRAGITNTLALISTTSVTGENSQVNWVNHQVKQLLDKANADASGHLWASLDRYLPMLAEAAPDTFLTIVLNELKRTDSILTTLFIEEEGFLFPNSNHTGLLWALESLAWPPAYLSDTALALAKLARIDPGGRIANRPINSLREIFIPWNPQTNVNANGRLAVLDRLRKEEPQIAWDLMIKLLPKSHDSSGPTHIPRMRWRDWQIKPRHGVLRKQYFESIAGTTERLLLDASTNSERWEQLIDNIPQLVQRLDSAELRNKLFEQLDNMGSVPLSDKARAKLRSEVRELLNHHRSFPQAEWSLNEKELKPFSILYEKLEPENLLYRHAWLFTDRPKLPEGFDMKKRTENRDFISHAQDAALAEILDTKGISCISELLKIVPKPVELGQAIGRSSLSEQEKIELLKTYLSSKDSPEHSFGEEGLAFSFVSILNESAGAFIKTHTKDFTPEQLGVWLAHLPMEPESWQIVNEFGNEVVEKYWLQARAFVRKEDDSEEAIRQFLRFKRAVAATEILVHLHYTNKTLPNDLLLQTLSLLAEKGKGNDNYMPDRHNLEILLDELIHTPVAEKAKAIQLAFTLSSVVLLKNPKILNHELQQNPAFFIEALGLLYKKDSLPNETSTGESSGQISPKFATMVWELFHHWDSLPGLQADGTLDEQALKAWVSQVKELAIKESLFKGFSCQLGQILSHSPTGPEGVWPHPAVCAIIEQEANNEHLEQYFRTGCFNHHGKNHAVDGGQREKLISENYARWASELELSFPTTARILRKLASTFLEMSENLKNEEENEDQIGI
ncbi:hypothetical protein Q0590_14185 [Rhodocytophaga aerolata]|uniref:Uncharacterized protein n=1 Tax=Rhodocytophaga aerolata TaxID=455078 RepID=A0ABT8R830_9BACT|nr:hypothetical protein [Rhodocytophaga aerolata]MDO1447413.1 hypothetical protein [Rhodocytophaga aerolata]